MIDNAIQRTGAVEARSRVLASLRVGGITPAFQAIADLHTGAIVGFEALARFADGVGPAERFAEAVDAGLGLELEVAAIEAALLHVDQLLHDRYLSVNVSPELAMSPLLLQTLAGAPLDRLVIEITEHTHVDDTQALLGALRDLRSRGARVAIDDVGAGYATMSLILELHPDVIKLDVSLTRGIHADTDRQALIASLIVFSRAMGSTIVAEGIETDAEAVTLSDLGVHCGQGYLLGKPGQLSLHAAYAVQGGGGGATGTAFGLAAHVTALVELSSSRADYEVARPRRLIKRMTVGALAAMMLLGPATIAAAHSAQPGNPLWWVKLRVEDVRLATERDEAARASLLAAYAERRLTELELLPARRRGLSLVVIARYESQVAQIRLVISASDLARLDPLREQLSRMLSGQRDALKAIVVEWCSSPGDTGCAESMSAARTANRAFAAARRSIRDPEQSPETGRAETRGPTSPPGAGRATDPGSEGSRNRPERQEDAARRR